MKKQELIKLIMTAPLDNISSILLNYAEKGLMREKKKRLEEIYVEVRNEE